MELTVSLCLLYTIQTSVSAYCAWTSRIRTISQISWHRIVATNITYLRQLWNLIIPFHKSQLYNLGDFSNWMFTS